MKLYEISDAINQVFKDNVNPETGEINPKAFEQISNLELDAVSKIHSCGHKLRELDDKIENITNLERKLRKEKSVLKNHRESLADYTAFYMFQLGIEEVFKDGFTVRLKELKDKLDVNIKKLLISAPEFCKASSYRAMLTELKEHIGNGGKIPEGVRVIKNRLGLDI